MAAPIWKTYAATPLGFGGIATFCSWLAPGSRAPEDAVLQAVAMVGIAQVASVTDPTAVLVDLTLGVNVETFAQGLLAGPVVVSWFARTAAGWVVGPVTTADLSATWTADFAYPKDWSVTLLQQLERETQPLGPGQKLEVRGAYPRDTMPLPALTVHFQATPGSYQLLGDVASNPSPTTQQLRRAWTVTLGLELWSETPEERDLLAAWFLSTMQAVLHLAPYQGVSEPTLQIQESDDFSMSKNERPLFITSATLAGTMWSSLTVPVHNPSGHFTV